ncbi:MFS transporter [Pseudoduganella chitinolytica]|uniref:MFS transporter n=1 Tax=Pseudoduganella chitinolytica TaxID=34070 RepID=A0ABY8B9I4_9BURK|nr:MFS transporter [Pseudoduganella chitinolytica]WEF31402.1 MFS transporter [Pseudoduganella chitinolytica]
MPYSPIMPLLSISLLLSWGSLYYAFPVLAPAMQSDFQGDSDVLTGAFSVALLIWGLATYPVGLALDRFGARAVMTSGALLAAVGFIGLYIVESVSMFYLLWSALGLAMAMTLYEPAFALIVQNYPEGQKRRIGWLTIAGGLASTVFWPLSYYLGEHAGWRHAMLLFAALHLLACLALMAVHLPRERIVAATRRQPSPPACPGPARVPQRAAMVHLSLCFAVYGFITAALAVQAIPLLAARGFDTATALLLASCIGPMQVAGRALDMVLGSRFDARRAGLGTLTLLSLSIAALWLAQWWPALAVVFVIAYGLAVGLLTVVRAMAPLELAAAAKYASSSGLLGAPSLVARAAGPVGAASLAKACGSQSGVLLVLLAGSLIGLWLFARAWSFTPVPA